MKIAVTQGHATSHLGEQVHGGTRFAGSHSNLRSVEQDPLHGALTLKLARIRASQGTRSVLSQLVVQERGGE